MLRDLTGIPSQTTVQERKGLYFLTKEYYVGAGAIYDIGTAAGGSTFCLACGLDDNDNTSLKVAQIYGFDLFEGYSLKAFKNNSYVKAMIETRGEPFTSDLELFLEVTADYQEYIKPIKMDIARDFAIYKHAQWIEIAHIDSAKTLSLWEAICPVISTRALPDRSVFVFQDFERSRLPWQWMYISELLQLGIITIRDLYQGGTLHVFVKDVVPKSVVERSITFSYTDEEVYSLWKYLKTRIEQLHNYDEKFCGNFEDIANCLLAYAYKQIDRNDLSKKIVKTISGGFLRDEPIYRAELL